MSKQEMIRYQEALDNARASVEMEGYRITDEQQSQCMDFVTGKIDKETYIQMLLKRCGV